MKIINLMCITGIAFIFGGSLAYSGEREIAEKFSQALNNTGSAVCRTQHNSKVIECIMHTDTDESHKIARVIVDMARARNIALPGWKIKILTLENYTATQEF